jgi:CRP-like cAMP-binding protein
MNQLESLKRIPALVEVPASQLRWIIEKGECQDFEKGDYLFSRGDPIDKLIIVLKGKFSLKIEQNGEFKTIAEIEEGEISGALPYSRATHAAGFSIAQQKSSIITLDKTFFREMIKDYHELTTALVHTMTTRVREFTRTQHQQEKLMSLGKLSAGLAHELNNPASAMVRSSTELRKTMDEMPEKLKGIISAELTGVQIDAINKILSDKNKPSDTEVKKWSLSRKAELEDEMAEWLEDHGVDDGYDYAPVLTDYKLEIADIEQMTCNIQNKDIPAVMDWILNVLTSKSLVDEINYSSARISDLVSSIKSYTHMDRGTEMEPLDVTDGINNTLKILGHKLKQKQINTELNFPDLIPKDFWQNRFTKSGMDQHH